MAEFNLEKATPDEIVTYYNSIRTDSNKLEEIQRVERFALNKFNMDLFEGDTTPKEAPTLAERAKDYGMSLTSGVGKGAAGAADLPFIIGDLLQKGTEFGYEKITGREPSDEFREGMERGLTLPIIGNLTERKVKPAVDAVLPNFLDYEPQEYGSEAVQRVGEFAPLAGKNVITMGVLPALTSFFAGKAAEDTPLQLPVEIVTALVTPSLAKKIISPRGGQISGITKQHLELLKKEGVLPTAGFKFNDVDIKAWEEATQAGRNLQEAAFEAFSRAALKRIGINSNRATGDQLRRVYDEMSEGFNSTINNLDTVANKVIPSKENMKILNDALRTYGGAIAPAQRSPIFREMYNAFRQSKRSGQSLSGEQLKYYHQTLNNMTRKGDETGDAARAILPELKEMIHRNLGAQGKEVWVNTNRRYRDFLAIERALKGGVGFDEGLVVPSRLASATTAVFRRKRLFGESDLGNLAQAGNSVMKVLPQSGTAPRLLGTGAGGAGQEAARIGAGTYALTQDPKMAGYAAVAGTFLPSIRNNLMGTSVGQQYMGNQLVRDQGRLGLLRMLGSSTLPNM